VCAQGRCSIYVGFGVNAQKTGGKHLFIADAATVCSR
jgi:hypothetical protein